MASVTGVVAAAPAGRLVAAGGVSVVLPGNWLLLDVAGKRRVADEVEDLAQAARGSAQAYQEAESRIVTGTSQGGDGVVGVGVGVGGGR